MARLVKIVEGPIDFEEALEAVGSPANGGVATFYAGFHLEPRDLARAPEPQDGANLLDDSREH